MRKRAPLEVRCTDMVYTTLTRFWREITIVALLVVVGWLFTLKNKTIVETKIEYVEKVVVKIEEKVQYVDRVTTKVRTIHKKGDEIHVREEIRAAESSVDTSVLREQEQENRRTEQKSVVTTSESPRFVLGISRDFTTRGFGGAIHYRPIPGLPIYLGPQVTVVNKIWTLGIGATLLL